MQSGINITQALQKSVNHRRLHHPDALRLLTATLIAIFLGQPVAIAKSAAMATDRPSTASLSPKPAAPESTGNPSVKPSFVTLTINKSVSQDMEIIQWPDGGISLPVKTFAALFDIMAQQSDGDQRLLFVDPASQKRVEIDWGSQTIKVNDQGTSYGKYPIVRSRDGLLIHDDVYVDQAILADWFGATFTFDSDSTVLAMNTGHKLKVSAASDTEAGSTDPDANTTLIRHPEIKTGLIEKIYVHHTSTYNYQASQQPTGADNRLRNAYLYTLMDTSTLGVSGTILGQSYYVKPSIIRYNGKANFQDVDWSIQHAFKNNVLSLGSADAGLSPLASPSLRVWGLKLASNNAQSQFLTPQTAFEFSGKAPAGHQITAHINNRTLQTTAGEDGVYEFDTVYLQPQTLNHISIVEKDAENHETVLMDKTIAAFQNLLPKGESAYSMFLGRIPLQFYPILPDQKTPMLMPQSNKWLAGGRLFYGLSNRLTVGLSAVGDHIYGEPKSYFTFLNPLSMDLTGFSSYQRDPNYANGENADLTVRYQLRDRWSLALDSGISRFDLKQGSLLPMPHSRFGTAEQLHLERQGSALAWFADLFRYSPYYYTPSSTLYGNTLFDKEGVGTGINGSLTTFKPVSYSLGWSRYRTNLEQIIPGGYIMANRWNGSVNSQLNATTNLSASVNWLDGHNRERELLQHSVDLALVTQSLPWRIGAEIRAGHYFTNTLFYASKTLGTQLVQSAYTNNSLAAALDFPLQKSGKNHIKIGNRLSTFVDYGFIQGFFQYKRIFFEPYIQKSYGNRPQNQDRFGIKLGYQFKNGTRLSVSYYKNASTFNPVLGGLPASKVKTDQFYVDFTDVIGLLANHPRMLGPNADTDALLTGTVFVDYSANGKRDKTEPGVSNLKLMVDKQKLVITDTKGQYAVTGLTPGYHILEVLPDTLPLTLSADSLIYKIKVTGGKTHRVNVCLASEGGTISGRVRLSNISNQPIAPNGIILVLTNLKGDILNYTAVDADGRYKFSNIAAGSYRIDLEPKLKASGRYKLLEAPGTATLAIPRHYDETTTLEHQNFKLLAL